MNAQAHPFATGGGGTLFEYKIATLFAADIVRARFTEHEGVVTALDLQTGPSGFDDMQVLVELLDGSHRRLHAQCRHVQHFTGSDNKFASLLAQAHTVVRSYETEFASGQRRLLVIVDRASPGWESMALLSRLARQNAEPERFAISVDLHAGKIRQRWSHCVRAAGSKIDSPSLHRIIASLEIRAVEVDSATSRDSVELIDRLAQGWDPPNLHHAANLANALFSHLAEMGPIAGHVDIGSLQKQLSSLLPSTIGAMTRRAKLERLRETSLQRRTLALISVGLPQTKAQELAVRMLATPPTAHRAEQLLVIVGPMGVGKTTELERLYLRAVDSAIADSTAPVPVWLHAKDTLHSPLDSVVQSQASELGDLSRVGVFLTIDGLDEAGVQVDKLIADVARLLGIWPNTQVILSSRPELRTHSIPTIALAPLSREVATELMLTIEPSVDSRQIWREEVAELLCRPLYAIRYALDRQKGALEATSEAQLVASVGSHAIAEIGGIGDSIYELLLDLACRIVDSGGRPCELRQLTATPMQIAQLADSRVVQLGDGHASFQLSILTEWFAASALLRDQAWRARSVSTPLRAFRWRYAFVQAILQGSSENVDDIMSMLLSHAPAEAAWVHYQVQVPATWRRTTRLTEGVIEAGTRVRTATLAWAKPWPILGKMWSVHGSKSTLGVLVDGPWMATCWRGPRTSMSDSEVELMQRPPDFFSPRGSIWTECKTGRPSNDPSWPWSWTFDQIRGLVDDLLASRELLAEVSVCWPELTWDYAHRILCQNPTTRSDPVARAELDNRLASFREHCPDDASVTVRSSMGEWRLSEAESFVSTLARRGVDQVLPPWPPPDTRGPWTWQYWSANQLLLRLNLVTKAALDAYQRIVESHLPTMASELDTYQLLPAQVVGTLLPGQGEGYESHPRYSWHLQPLQSGPNAAKWVIKDELSWPESKEFFNSRVRELEVLRGEVSERVTMTSHGGEPAGLFSSTPAGALALRLLANDLTRYNWTSGLVRLGTDTPGAVPRGGWLGGGDREEAPDQVQP